MIRLLILIQM